MVSLKSIIKKATVDGVLVTIPPFSENTYIFAKSEIERFLSDAFSCKILNVSTENSVKINLGKSTDFSFTVKHVKPEGFDVIISDREIYIVSDSGRGIIYGAYDMLEKTGIKFLTPDFDYLPKNPSGEIGSYYSDPDFDIRMYLTKNICDGDFAVKQRMYSENISIAPEKGDTLEWSWELGCNHSTLNFVPPKVYYTEENKEQNAHMYLFNKDGKPVDICMSDGITEDGEIDESMEVSAFKIALKSLIDLVEKNKTCKYISFGQMDTTYCCQCERCQKAEKIYKRSGMAVRFANLLLKYLKKYLKEKGENRKIYLVIFAYEYSTVAPVTRDENGNTVPIVKADDDLCVRIAPIGANSYFPIQSDMHFMPYKRIIDEWRIVCKNIMLWTYHTNYKRYLWYFPTLQHWKEDLKYFKDINVKYMFMQSDHTESVDWKADMETYIASKMMWDCSLDPFKIRDEYIDAVFGIANNEVKTILNIFDENYKEIAERSVKMRYAFWRELFGDAERIPENMETAEICKRLREEANVEWTKNVYFSVYHKEIGWAKEQPKELLEEQMKLLLTAKEKVNGACYMKTEKTRIITALEKLELTLRYMILYNYDNYYKDKEGDKSEFSKEFFDLCEKLGLSDFGEGVKLEKIKENLDYNW